jgi:hypothetical protein
MGSGNTQLIELLAYESLVQRLGVRQGGPGRIVDNLVIMNPTSGRKAILRRENERLRELFEESAHRIALPNLSARTLNDYFTGRSGYAVARRRVARRLSHALPAAQRITSEDHVRQGYLAVFGGHVMLTAPVTGLISIDVFPDDCVYFAEAESFRYWSREAKGRMQFSVELVEDARIEKLVMEDRAW